MDAQFHVLQWSLIENDYSMGIVMLRVLCCKKGQLWTAEMSAVGDLRRANLKDHVDARDQRPLTYQGKMVFASHVDKMRQSWRRTPIFKTRRTPEDPQSADRDMAIIEDIASGDLPISSDDTHCMVQGASKFEQLGTPCVEAILDASHTDLEMPSRETVLMADLRARTIATSQGPIAH